MIIIAGATGFIGFALAEGFANAGEDVVCVCPDDRQGAARLPSHPAVRPLSLPHDRAGQWAESFAGLSPAAVINAAGAGVRPDQRDPRTLVQGNETYPCQLMTAVAASRPAVFIHLGSWLEYAAPQDRQPVGEDALLTSRNSYGKSKLAGAAALRTLADQLDVPFAILRLFHVFGPGEPSRRLTPYLINNLRRSSAVKLSSHNKVRDMVYIEDVVAAVRAAVGLGSKLAAHGTYNICSGIPVSIGGFARTVAELLDRSPDLLEFGATADRDDEPFWMVGDPGRFHAATGWAPSFSLEQALAATISEFSGAAADQR
ncbi:MAG: NAD(P)-dependent oxidoreductase [Magnetovibrio sp.]|nr:NAD(P)-dependent oxidoreductase [Magnetovibrio sp.]